MRGGGGELHKSAATESADREAAERCDTTDHTGPARRMRGIQINQRRTECRHRRTGGDALQQPGDQQDGDVTGGDEQHQGNKFQRDRRGQHGSPPDVVTQCAEDQQRADQPEHVHREDHGEGNRRETPLLLVDHVQAATARWRPP